MKLTNNMKPYAWWATQKFGKLRIKDHLDLNPKTKKKLEFLCECGKNKLISVYDVTSGKTTSCGRCNEMSPEWWSKQKFGRLALKNPSFLNKNSKKKEVFICICGTESLHSVYSVTSGKCGSCGKCNASINNWFKKNKKEIRELKTPITNDEFPKGGPILLEVVRNVSKPFKASCSHCGSIYFPRFSSIRLGKSLTCGCSSNLISKPNLDIQEFIESNGFDTELEYKLSGYRYDIHIKKCKTLIEFQGTLFHSSKEAIERDKKKKHIAEIYGFKLLQINESEWRKNKQEIYGNILKVLHSRKNVGYNHLCKNEIFAKIEELDKLRVMQLNSELENHIKERQNKLINMMKTANEDIVSAVISSHHVMCSVKNMSPNEAFGNDPFVYYGLGLVGESGELAGALLRIIRNSGTHEDKRIAIEEELADCIIYAIVLAYSTGIDIVKVLNEKVQVVIDRAQSGYYGGPLKKD